MPITQQQVTFGGKRQAAVVGLFIGLSVILSGMGAGTASADDETDFIRFSKIDAAWKHATGEGTRVAVLDWLFDLSPESSKKYVDPTSLIPNQPIGKIESWHGEWMAQIVHRVAPGAEIMPIRARPSCNEEKEGPCDDQAYEKYAIEGIRLAADRGAVAVTNSMGPLKHSPELIAAVKYAADKGTLFIDVHPEYVVMTKDRFEWCTASTCSDRILHVGVVSVDDHPAEPDPARQIYVWAYNIDPVFRDGWGYSNGPPIVAGVVALMKSENSGLSPRELIEIIVETAEMRDGFAVLNAEAAVLEAARRSGARGSE